MSQEHDDARLREIVELTRLFQQMELFRRFRPADLNRRAAFPWRVQMSSVELLELPTGLLHNNAGQEIRSTVLLCGVNTEDDSKVHIFLTSQEDIEEFEQAFFPQGPGSMVLPDGVVMYIRSLASRDYKQANGRRVKYTLGNYAYMAQLTASIESKL